MGTAVLWIDPSPSLHAIYSTLLEALGVDTFYTAHSVEQGMELVRAWRFNLILLSEDQETSTALAFAAEVRNADTLSKFARIALVSATRLEPAANEPAFWAIDAVLRKPVTAKALRDQLARVAQHL